MRLALILCLVAVAAAAPEKDAYTLVDERTNLGDGRFSYKYETSNGISAQKTGTPGVEGQSNMEGSFRFTHPDGTITEIIYIADENGYKPKVNQPTFDVRRSRP
ncbi:cuticle protein AMP1A-like [Procambarus clarkii]|uniref:cuticle protein AMP1A-like n=1 Tax=Procambarus clarkii TaxID=6728 RepID=UPI001E67645B|nr:cuticle protein AMP1A-like [Procambarus clarkii]